jgi:serine/threonine-protein kinase
VADLELLVQLERIRMGITALNDDHIDTDLGDRLYAEAFRAFGVDVDALPPKEVVERIRRTTVAVELVEVLDDWAIRRQIRKHRADTSWQHLLQVARSADANREPSRVRDIVEHGDRQALLDMAAVVDISRLHPATLAMLGASLRKVGADEQALMLLRKAQRSHAHDFWINHDLAMLLQFSRPPQYEEAVRFFTAAVALRPQSPGAHLNLGNSLWKKGDLDGAIAEFREAIRLERDYGIAYIGVPVREGPFTEPPGEGPFHENACSGIAIALADKKKLPEALEVIRGTIEHHPNSPRAYNRLGVILAHQKELPEAVEAFHKAIELKPDFAEAHCDLGHVLTEQGLFADALAELKRGHELGSRILGWHHPSAQWVRAAERRVELDAKLPAILIGEEEPADTAERLGLAQLCQMPCKKRFAAAQRFYSEAFAAEPKLADDLNAQHRYNAACAAALAGCGQGVNADKLDEKERARLRQQALDWLRADLKAYRQAMERAADKVSGALAQRLQHWLQDNDFAGVRGPDALAKLPEAEREEWQKLWQEVEALRQRAAKPPAEANPARP